MYLESSRHAHLVCFPRQSGLKELGGGLPLLQVAPLLTGKMSGIDN
jgi:hypothetical protein